MDFFEETSTDESCQSIRDETLWQPMPSVLNRGFTDKAIWLRVNLEQAAPARFIVFKQAMIGEVLFCGDGPEKKAGVFVPVNRWPLQLRYPTFQLPESEGPFYFRVRSNKVINFPVQVLGISELLQQVQFRQVAQFSLLAGGWITALLLLVVHLFSTRKSLYLLLSLSIFSASFALFIVYGDAYLYFWPESPQIQAIMFKSTSMLAGMFASLFVRSLLRTWQWAWLDRIILVAISFQGLAALSSFWHWLDPFFFVVLVSAPFIGLLITIPVAFFRLREGDVPVRFYFLAWIVLISSFVFNILVFRGILDYQSSMAYAPIFAAPFMFFLLGLGSFIRLQSEQKSRLLLQEKNRLLMEELKKARAAVAMRGANGEPASSMSMDVSAFGSGIGAQEESPEQSKGTPSNMLPGEGPPSADAATSDSGPVRSQLTGVDIEAKKALLLQAMEEDRLYELEDLRLEILARHIDLRPHQLSELLNQVLNTSFADFLRWFRIDAATRILGDPDSEDSILDIGLAVGFGSKTAFNRSFSALTGVTPGEYRKQARAQRYANAAGA